MNEKTINDKISYMEATENPLSADIGIVKDGEESWLYDVGNGDSAISGLDGSYNVVLSHFHPDHIGNIGKLNVRDLYVSKETYRYLPKDMKANIHIVTEPVVIGNLHIFPIPSSHSKGCLGLEVDDSYAFVGDALYCRFKDNSYVYNAQLLKDGMRILKTLKSSMLLCSHYKGLVRSKDEVLAELEEIYSKRVKDSPEIVLR